MAINFLNTVAVDENVLFVDTVNDRVGIGTATPSYTLQVGDGTEDSAIAVYYSDGEYTRINGYGLYMSRVASYIRPVTTTTQSLYVGVPDNIWNAIYNNANTHYFATGANEHMRISSSGNVGIGTASPVHKLTVDALNDTTAVGIDFPSAHFDFSANSTSGYTTLFNMDDTGLDIGHDVASRSLNLKTNNLDRLTILGGGNVGIGTTSPLSQFQVNGQASVLGNSFNGLAYFNGTNALASYNTANKIVMSSNGSADGLYTGGLHLTRRALTQQGHFGSGIRGISVGTVLQDNALELYTSTNTEQNATRLKIASNGNVGIGTTSPGYPLVVNGEIAASGDGYLINGYGWASEGSGVLTLGDWDGNEFSTRIMDQNSDEVLRVTDGNVGIGTITPDYKLDVEGDISLVGGGENYAIMSPIQQGMQIAVGDPAAIATPLVTFHGDQKVGIGTATPASALQVDGGVQIADDTDAASADKVGTLKYRVSGNNSYVDMCMQTGATTYAWINIVQNNW